MLASNAGKKTRAEKMALARENTKQETMVAIFVRELEAGFTVVNHGIIKDIVKSTSGERVMLKFHSHGKIFLVDSIVWIETL